MYVRNLFMQSVPLTDSLLGVMMSSICLQYAFLSSLWVLLFISLYEAVSLLSPDFFFFYKLCPFF